MKVIALGASISSTSINQQLAAYAAKQFAAEVDLLNLNDFQLPMYSSDLEASQGIPSLAGEFLARLDSADLIIISLAEHNGSYAAGFKNTFDWASRSREKLFSGNPMLLLSTSPGTRGGQTVIEAALGRWPYMGANIVASYSLPSFYQNFDAEKGITNEVEMAKFTQAIDLVKTTLASAA